MPSPERKLNGPRCSAAPGYVQLEFVEEGRTGTPYGARERPTRIGQLEFYEGGRVLVPYSRDTRLSNVVDFLRKTIQADAITQPTVRLLNHIAEEYGITEGDAMRVLERLQKGAAA